MSVSFRWTQAGRRGLPVAKRLLAGLTLTTALAAATPGPGPLAASFDEPDQTNSVLLHDPTSGDPGRLALNPPPTVDDSSAAGTSEVVEPESPSAIVVGGCTTDGDEPCLCAECTAGGQCQGSGDDRSISGLVETCANLCRSKHAIADCDPPGLLQKLGLRHKRCGACWTGRAELLLMWRNAPQSQPLLSTFDPATSTIGPTAFDANQLESALAAGPRFTLMRTNQCGHGFETTYFRAFNFRSQEQVPLALDGYALTPPGIFGNNFTAISGAGANLGSGIQSFELNGRRQVFKNLALLGGFRWVEWRESLTMIDGAVDPATGAVFFDDYNTNCINSLYGGQIGFDTRLVELGSWLRVDSWMKGGAYYNNAVQTSVFASGPGGGGPPPPPTTLQTSAQIGAAAFVGELGMVGVIPLTRNLDFQFGYLALWLESLAQPTNQLYGQTLVENQPPAGSITTTGGTVVQGLTLGLTGRW